MGRKQVLVAGDVAGVKTGPGGYKRTKTRAVRSHRRRRDLKTMIE